MAFTTNGLELIRLSAIAWPSKKSLIDVLVRPAGHILDLNTRFSGVTIEMLESAKPWVPNNTLDRNEEDGMDMDGPSTLRIIESPAAARELLFSFLTPSTPLIGHAIENDLNAVRIIHPCIIDTVILFPHDAGPLPSRLSLKTLTKKFLWREIQTAGAEGHDSSEDAVATADLVILAVIRQWRQMQHKLGWKIEDGKIVPPAKGVTVAAAKTTQTSAPSLADYVSAIKRKRDEGDETLDYGYV